MLSPIESVISGPVMTWTHAAQIQTEKRVLLPLVVFIFFLLVWKSRQW